MYADAAGPPSTYNPDKEPYGMGGLCLELGLAWQVSRKHIKPFLELANDTQNNPDSINSEELCAQIFQM